MVGGAPSGPAPWAAQITTFGGVLGAPCSGVVVHPRWVATAAQHIVAEYIARGGLEDHLAGIRLLYRERKEAMLDAIRRHLGDRVVTTDPEGGFFLWLTLRGEFAEIDTRELFETALADGVAFIPGPALSPTGRFRNALRLCFASSTPERIDEGIRRLAGSCERMTQNR
mgnify:CR=1 FL=1